MNMPANGFAYRPPQRERHLVFAAMAFLLSAMLHVGLVYWTRDMRIDASEFADQARGRQQERNRLLKPLHVERVPGDPQRPMFAAAAQPAAAAAAVENVTHLPLPMADLSSPLPPAPQGRPADTMPGGERPAVAPVAPLLPRQEVVTILEKRVDDALAALPRREVAAIERAARAPDFVPAADAAASRAASGSGFRPSDLAFGLAGFQAASLPPSVAGNSGLLPPADLENSGTAQLLSERFADAPETAPRFTAIDDRLDLATTLYRDAAAGRAYFRLSIRPRSGAPLPALPKDLLLVQDCSASMSETRLYFCRQALAQILKQLGPDDRFNILAFSETALFCFGSWEPADEPHKAKALAFISGLRSRGETDLYASLQRALELPRDKERPVVVLMITDGRPTTGLTASTAIIGNFTRINDAGLSVLGFGTQPRANTYLLDMLAYCNRGETRLNRSGRWNIPGDIESFAAGVAHPVMHDVRFVFDSASGSEVYPKLTMNLYAGRSLDLYGSCAMATRELVVQLRGRAAGRDYDAVVHIDLEKDTAPGTAELRERWAWQRMYHLIGLYARDPKPLYREVMQGLHDTYAIPIPYMDDLGR